MVRRIVAIVTLFALCFGAYSACTDAPEAQADDAPERGTVEMIGVPIPNSPVKAPQFETYVAKKGDSLWKIAKMFEMTVDELLEANPGHSDRVFAHCEKVRMHVSFMYIQFLDEKCVTCNGNLMTSDKIDAMARETVMVGWEFNIPWDKFFTPMDYKEFCKQFGNAADCKPIWI